jgi:hypothetical protein
MIEVEIEGSLTPLTSLKSQNATRTWFEHTNFGYLIFVGYSLKIHQVTNRRGFRIRYLNKV